MKHLLNIAILLCLGVNQPSAQENPNWLRYTAISPDGQTIAFTYKGDIYTIPANGGTAKALTFNEAYDYMPVWSHDGKSIAFASDRYGNFDVFVVNFDGGESKRLTFHSKSEYPYSFAADDKSVIFGGQRQDIASHRQFPTGSQPELYSVPVNSGRVTMVWTYPAEAVQVSKDGQFMVYHDKKGGENEYRKHHTSAITRDIWLYNSKTGEQKMITNFKGEDRNPVFADNDKYIYYISEESGNFNVHKLSLENPQNKQQVTNLKKFPVRFLSISNSGTLCFSYDGELYTLAQGGEPKKVAVNIRTEEKRNNDVFLSISGNAKEMDIAPNGKEVVYIVRGEVFVSSVEGGVTKRITNTPEQERFVSFSPDGESILYASERGGKWQIYQTQRTRKEEPFFYASTVLKEEPLFTNDNNNYQPQYSPDGKEIAFIENRASLVIYNIASKQTRTLLTPNELYYMSDGDQYFSWSPDSKWLLVEYSPVMANGEVVLIAADGKSKMINLTQSGYSDSHPKWVNEGKQLLWFSTRDGLRSYANSGDRQADVYSMFFTKDAWDRYNLSKEDYTLLKAIEEKEKEKEKKKKDEAKDKDKKVKKTDEVKKDSTLKFDWEDLAYRKARFTINSSSLGDAVLSKDGETLYYLSSFEKDLNLWSINLRTKEPKMEISLDAKSGSLKWDKEMKNLFLLADGKISKINIDKGKRETVGINGEMRIDKAAEMKYMFDHVWQRSKTGFYISTFHGANWDELKTDYMKYLPSIGSGYEFTDMLSEMLGELNSSHSGASYRPKNVDGDATASLGVFIDYDYVGDGVKIAEILKGGPLDKSNIKVNAGMIIEQIDGEIISANRDYNEYLNRKADKFTLLQVFDPTTNTRQQISIKPIGLGDESGLLYRRWVKKNEAEVDKLSDGTLGYVHIPGMGDGPYRDIYEEMMGKFHNRKGVIIDTRFNGGGDLVSDLAMFFTGKKFIDYSNDKRLLGYEPTFRWTKPTIAMFNESNYSDGSCFACGYQQLNIGKTVGMPTPGTCSWAGWEGLPDGVTNWGMVPVSAKEINEQWMENLETVPDFVVKNEPLIISKGRDQQLEKAVEELLKMVK
ncbi:MAG: peptidase S41 [Bacteroidales bacterium]|nr:MAG: peptidase S41 [Bacteroidales bacterium]